MQRALYEAERSGKCQRKHASEKHSSRVVTYAANERFTDLGTSARSADFASRQQSPTGRVTGLVDRATVESALEEHGMDEEELFLPSNARTRKLAREESSVANIPCVSERLVLRSISFGFRDEDHKEYS